MARIRFKRDDQRKSLEGDDKMMVELYGGADGNTAMLTGDDDKNQFEIKFRGGSADNEVVIDDLDFSDGDLVIFKQWNADLVGRGQDGGVSNGQIKSLAHLQSVADFLTEKGKYFEDGDDIVFKLFGGNTVRIKDYADEINTRGGDAATTIEFLDGGNEGGAKNFKAPWPGGKSSTLPNDIEYGDFLADGEQGGDGKEVLFKDFDLADGDLFKLGQDGTFSNGVDTKADLEALANSDEFVGFVDVDGDGDAKDAYFRVVSNNGKVLDIILEEIAGENALEYNGLEIDNGMWMA